MSFEPERFSAVQIEPRFFEGERHKDTLIQAMESLLIEGQAGQRIEIRHLNRGFTSYAPLLWNCGFLEDPTTVDMAYAGYQLAAWFPESEIVMAAMPAHGKSDRLLPEQRKEIAQQGSLYGVSKSMALAAGSRLKTVDRLILTGRSAGTLIGSYMAALAPELEWAPEQLVGFSMAGLDARNSVAGARAFIKDGWLNQAKYHHGPLNLQLDAEFNERFKADMAAEGLTIEHNAYLNDARVFTKEVSFLKRLLYKNPLFNDEGFVAIERALEANPAMEADLFFGALDQVFRWRRIAPGIERLMSAYPQFQVHLLPFDNHAMGVASQQPRLSALMREVVHHSPI